LGEPVRSEGLDLPGVYYRCFRLSSHPGPLWTLRLSLVYPLAVSAVFPLLWLRQLQRTRHNQPMQATPR
jgi:hypothetical protein